MTCCEKRKTVVLALLISVCSSALIFAFLGWAKPHLIAAVPDGNWTQLSQTRVVAFAPNKYRISYEIPGSVLPARRYDFYSVGCLREIRLSGGAKKIRHSSKKCLELENLLIPASSEAQKLELRIQTGSLAGIELRPSLNQPIVLFLALLIAIGLSVVLFLWLHSPEEQSREKATDLPPDNRYLKLCSLFFFSLLTVSVSIYALYLLGEALLYELSAPFSGDATHYLTLGRTVLNGFTPYLDYLENKPPGIFYLAAIWLWLRSDGYVGEIFQTCITALTAFVPLIFAIIKLRSRKRFVRWLGAYAGLLFGCLLALNMQYNAAGIQIEPLAAALILLYALLIFSDKPSFTIAGYCGSFLCLFFAIGLKEPFFLSAASVSLILSANIKEWLLRFFLVSLLVGIAGTAALVILGYHSGYLLYLSIQPLPFSTPAHLGGWALRALYPASWLKMWEGSPFFVLVCAYLFVWSFLVRLGEPGSRKQKALRVTLLILGCYLAQLGYRATHYCYLHHWVVVVPTLASLYLLAIAQTAKYSFGRSRIYGLYLFCVLLSFALLTSRNPYRGNWLLMRHAQIEHAYRIAQATDAILESCNMQNYFFLGGGPVLPTAFVMRSPGGPLVAGNKHWVKNNNPNLRKKVVESFAKSDLIVHVKSRPYIRYRPLRRKLHKLEKKNFSKTPWRCARKHVVSDHRYGFWFRKKHQGKH